MDLQMMKMPGGVLIPAFETEEERLQKFRNNLIYPIQIVQSRNPDFHGKVFAFLQFCFNYWSGEQTDMRFKPNAAQFDTFRRNLMVLAGYKDITFTMDGRLRVEAKSLAYSAMEQSEFEECYSAMINAALVHVFGNTKDPAVLKQLEGFF